MQDDYQSQGRVLTEHLNDGALATGIAGNSDSFTQLANAYKRINAPLGELGMATLKISTVALAGNQGTYTSLESELQAITQVRNALAARMIDSLNKAEFEGKPVDPVQAKVLLLQADNLIALVDRLAANPHASN